MFYKRLPFGVSYDPSSRRGVGLGDVVKTTTSFLGFKPCTPCERRAEFLNRVRLVPRLDRVFTKR